MSVPCPSTATVDLGAYAANLHWAHQRAGKGLALAAVIKADGYGLGAVPLARRALQTGASYLAVATPSEGAALRDAGIDAPVLLMTQPFYDALPAVLAYRLEPLLCDRNGAAALNALATEAGDRVRVHVMVDTGMGRQGMDTAAAVEDIAAVAAFDALELAGIATHYPIADVTADPFTRQQIARLSEVAAGLRARGIDCGHIHGANSAGVVNAGDPLFTMVRAGIMTYGVWPTDTPPDPNPIQPVLRWTTRISQLRRLPAGHSVSYGRTYVTPEDCTVAVLPVGYADGYRRAFSNRAEVLIRGQRCPVRGRVCMDQTVVEVSHVPAVAEGDEVVLAGSQAGGHVTLEELAVWADTIPYEILTGIGQRVARVYVN